MDNSPLSDNPFASPLAPPEHRQIPAYSEIWIDGRDLVVRSGVILPRRCVRTNVPTPPDCECRKTFAWASPWIYLLLLANLLVLIIVYILIRKQCTITYSEAKHINQRRRIRLAVVALLIVISIAGFFFSISERQTTSMHSTILVSSILLFSGSLIAMVFVSQHSLRIARHKDGHFWIRGCSHEFLNDLAAGRT